ncbi:Mur ligase family protein [Rhizobiaceae bacterium BDR2-2]|uniref:Dihydrofolate synthase/folylpolyglutamate synthase n=1 Tax=Ectorhizobium quercum TaxID=2965071 RepID=A0AAE3SW05_9HYPH|nr:Mur ligase family protein [Ectorhizobium quercum]MCX8996269.1 Mur ligase family protein [Ectorhizobium quercum]MCX8998692.1 Mur ligase family protein [Ectorhizobium quercum]
MRKIHDQHLIDVLAELDGLTNWESRPRDGMRVDLEPIRDLAARLGHPERSFRSIHVAGTKGKSSTCALLEAALSRAGFRVGRYSSPHVEYFGERMTLDGHTAPEPVMAQALARALEALKQARAQQTPAADATWFDVLTIAAFLVFREAGVEWAVVETGLGGRLDSTNVVPSDVAIVTNIELEHTEVLGDTRAKIAFEKAGIVKPARIAVTPLTADDEAGAVIAARADELGAALIVPVLPEDATIAERNTQVVGAALEALGERGVAAKGGAAAGKPLGAWLLDRATLEAARLPGRMEFFDVNVGEGAGARRVHVVLDGAHVPFNLAAVLADLRRTPEHAGACLAVVSIARDKDAEGLLGVLAKAGVTAILTRANDRSRDPAELAAVAEKLGLAYSVEADPLDAYAGALRRAAAAGQWVLVTGSLYMTGVVPRP